jgi:hypothetical protein
MTVTGKLTRQALDFAGAIREIAARAKQQGFTADAWNALAQGVAINTFLYVGRTKEALRWADFLTRLDRWSRATDFASTVDRVEQSGNLVFLQLDERSTTDNTSKQLTTMTIFEFDAEDRLRRIDSFQ